VNPIEKIEGATKAGRELRFYNFEVWLVYFIVLATCLCENPSPQMHHDRRNRRNQCQNHRR
jgi:hypothetical protein